MRAILFVCLVFSVASADAVPENLDRAAISSAVAVVKPEAETCGTKSKVKGIVKVEVKVLPSGGLDHVSIVATPDKDLGDCVLVAMKKLVFPATKNGGSFHYPFAF